MAEEERILEVTPDFDGKRIDQCLAASFSDCSRSFLQKLLKDGKVSINVIMIKFTLAGLCEIGFDKTQIYTTMELRMKCGIGKCGRCNIGSKYVCKDGPVFRCDELDALGVLSSRSGRSAPGTTEEESAKCTTFTT